MPAYQRGSIGLFFKGDPNLKAWWSLDELDATGLDLTGNGNNFTIVGTLKSIGKWGLGAYNNGSTANYGYFSSNSYTNVSTPFVVLWVYIDTLPSADTTLICNSIRGAWGDGRGYYVYINTSGQVIWTMGNASGSWNHTTSLSSLSLKQWHCIVAGYDGTYIKIYIDGKLDTVKNVGAYTISYTASPSGGPNPSTFYLGIQHANNNTAPTYTPDLYYPLRGQIDEIGLFSRALSPQEISAYYNWATGQKKKSYYILGIPSAINIKARRGLIMSM